MATVKSVFGKYAERLQGVVDAKKEAFATPWFSQYFDFGVKQKSVTFAQIIGRSRIEAAASIITRGSAAPLRSRQGLEKLSGEIPQFAQKFTMDENDYRSVLQLIEDMRINEGERNSALLNLLFNDVRNAGESPMRRLDIMVQEAISTGLVKVNTTNNPDGVVVDDIDLLMPSGNKTNAATVWSTSATATPITDFETVVEYQRNRGVILAKALMTPAAWSEFRKTTEVKDYLGSFYGKTNNKVLATLDAVNEFLNANRLPMIEIVDKTYAIESDGVLSSYQPFSDANVAFVPGGKLGKIHMAYSLEELEPVDGVSYAQYNGALISKWRDNEPYREFTKVEMNAFPGLDAVDSIHLLTI
jgi:hypothetical protein